MVRKIDFADDLLPLLEAEAARLKTTLSGMVNMLLACPVPARTRPLSGLSPAPAQAGSGPGETFKEGGEGDTESPNTPPSRKAGRTPRTPRASSPDEPAGFTEFWGAYPRKDGRKAALRAWNASARGRPVLGDLLAAVEAQAAARGWPSPFTPMAASWLNGARWADPALPFEPAVRAPPPAWPSTATTGMHLACGCGQTFDGTPHEAELAGWDWHDGWAACSPCLSEVPG